MAEGGQKRDPVNHRTKAQVARNNKKHGTTPKAKADRAARNRGRRAAIKAGIIKKGSSKDVHHKDGNPMNNRISNLRASSTKENRGHQRKS